MRVTAYIVLFSLMVMGIHNLNDTMADPDPQVEISCEKECCKAHDDCGMEEEPSEDHCCPSGCDCDCCYHVYALNFQFINLSSDLEQACHYGAYCNSYQFEYHPPHFHPPRLG